MLNINSSILSHHMLELLHIILLFYLSSHIFYCCHFFLVWNQHLDWYIVHKADSYIHVSVRAHFHPVHALHLNITTITEFIVEWLSSKGQAACKQFLKLQLLFWCTYKAIQQKEKWNKKIQKMNKEMILSWGVVNELSKNGFLFFIAFIQCKHKGDDKQKLNLKCMHKWLYCAFPSMSRLNLMQCAQ